MSEIQDIAKEQSNDSVDASLINKLNAGEVSLKDLSESQRDEIMQSQGVIEAPPEQATPQADLVTNQEAPQEQIERTVEEPRKLDLGEKYKQKADELNTYKQKLTSAERRQEEHERKLREDPIYREAYFKELGIKNESQRPTIETEIDDVYDEQALLSMREEQKRLREELDQFKQSKQAEIESERRKMELDRTFRNIEELQNEFPDLKTTKSFKEMNDEYVAFSGQIGLSNVDRVMSDPNYRQELQSQGIAIPQELDKTIKILKVNKTKQESGYPTLRSAYLDTNDFRASLQQQQQSSQQTVYQNGMDMVVNKVNELNSSQPVAPSAGNDNMIDNNEMNQEFMSNWIRNNPDPQSYNAAQQETWSKIQHTMNSMFGG